MDDARNWESGRRPRLLLTLAAVTLTVAAAVLLVIGGAGPAGGI